MLNAIIALSVIPSFERSCHKEQQLGAVIGSRIMALFHDVTYQNINRQGFNFGNAKNSGLQSYANLKRRRAYFARIASKQSCKISSSNANLPSKNRKCATSPRVSHPTKSEPALMRHPITTKSRWGYTQYTFSPLFVFLNFSSCFSSVFHSRLPLYHCEDL